MKTESRLERKYLIPDGVLISDVEGVVLRNTGIFNEIYVPRVINNIYFDTPGMDFYNDNIEGSPEKYKVRVRWYGDDFSKASLEIKSKKGYVTHKFSFPFEVKPFEKKSVDFQSYFISAQIPDFITEKCRNLIPVVKNKYTRKYFLSADSKFRITLDSNISYTKDTEFANQTDNYPSLDSDSVLEVKYQAGDEADLSRIVSTMPFRLFKFSKYVRGVETVFNR